ncbi:MAG: glycosyltransferase family 4 protein [Candidatus Dojkabacteria bacterium]|nr:MAG: glycosyltransferase family 4 protein [Candidatus Dojkabacteria bacterium]
MNKPRLLITASTFPRWANDKIPTFMYELARQLTKDYDVHVLAPHFKGAKTNENMDGINVHRFRYGFDSWEILAYGGGVVNNLEKNPFALLSLPLYILSSLFSLLYLQWKYKFQVMNIHWFVPMGVLAILLKPLLGSKIVVTSHGGDVFAVRKQKALSLFPMKKIISYVIKNADHVTLVSSGVQEYLSENFPAYDPGKTSVVPMGIDTNQFTPVKHEATETSRILFVGRLVEKKGVNYLIEAAKILKEKNLSFHIDIVGDGPLRPDYETLAEKLNVTDNITFHGFVVNTEVPGYLQRSSLFAGPSVVAKSGDQEGLPVTFMEAMATGIPVVVSDTPGVKDLVTSDYDGIVVPQYDSVALAAGLEKLLADATLRKTFSERARQKALAFDWPKIAAQFTEIYEKVSRPSLLIVASTFPRWKNDTISNFVYALAKNLSTTFNVHILAPHHKDAKTYEVMEGMQVHRFVYFIPKYERLAYGGGAVNNMKKSRLIPLLVPFYLVSNLFAMIGLQLKYRYNIVNVHWILPSGFLAALIKPLFKFRLVLTSHGGDIFGLKGMAVWKILGLERFAKFIVNRAQAITAVSSALEEEIISIGGIATKDKISVLPMGIYVDQFYRQNRKMRQLSKNTKTKFIFVGRHAQEKSLTTLLDALKILKEKGYNFSATIAGDGPEKMTLEQKAKDLGIASDIVFPGYVPNTEVADLFYKHDILLNCSVREGLPTVFMEAMATGLPIIVTNTQGISDLVADHRNGLVVGMKDPEAIAKACEELIENETLYKTISANALKTAYKYDWKIISKQYEDVLLP